MLRSQRFSQQRIVQKIDLADGQIVCRAPIGVDPMQVLLLDDVRFSSLGYCVLTSDTHRPVTETRFQLWVFYSARIAPVALCPGNKATTNVGQGSSLSRRSAAHRIGTTRASPNTRSWRTSRAGDLGSATINID